MGTRILDETAVDKIVYEERKSYFDITKTLSSFNFYCFFLHEGLLAFKQSPLHWQHLCPGSACTPGDHFLTLSCPSSSLSPVSVSGSPPCRACPGTCPGVCPATCPGTCTATWWARSAAVAWLQSVSTSSAHFSVRMSTSWIACNRGVK